MNGSEIHLQYEITLDDVLAFQRYHFAHSKTIRNQNFLHIGLVAIIAIATSLLIESDIDRTTRLVLAVVVTLVLGVMIHFRNVAYLEHQAKKLLAEGKNDGMLGTHELRIEEDALAERTDVNETRHAWSAIERIEETDDYAFIYISSIQAHVVPKHGITQGDCDLFLTHVRQRVSAAVGLRA